MKVGFYMKTKNQIVPFYVPVKIEESISGLPFTMSDVGMSRSDILVFDHFVLKREKIGFESRREHETLEYFSSVIPVPKVRHYVEECGYSYLLMERVNGTMAFDKSLLEEPLNLIELLANTLRKLWDIDIKNAPKYSLVLKLEHAEYNVNQNLVDENDFDLETIESFSSSKEILSYLKANTPQEELVMTHGDFCLPNIFFGNNELTGLIDLGRSGVADKWQDIALCIRSTKYNLGDKYKAEYLDYFLSCLDVDLDEKKMKYYLLLDELF